MKRIAMVANFVSSFSINLVRSKNGFLFYTYILLIIFILLKIFPLNGSAEETDNINTQVQVLDIEIASDKDDAEERLSNGRVYLTSSDLELGYEKKHAQAVGLRFINIPLPKGAKVVSSYLQFQVDEKSKGPSSLLITGQASTNAQAFSKTSFDISGRAATRNKISWSPREWTLIGERSYDQRSPDLSPILNEIIAQKNWTPGNAIVFIITGSGTRTAEAFHTRPPILHVEYIKYAHENFAGSDFNCNLRTDLSLEWPALDNKPDYLSAITDHAFGTAITRIVADPDSPIITRDGSIIGNWPEKQERHGYSKRQPWNADESLIFLDRCDNLFLDGRTYRPLFKRSRLPGRVRWSYTRPTIMHFVSSDGVGDWDVLNDSVKIKVPLNNYSGCSFGNGEGNFAWDEARVAILATRKSDGHKVIFVVNIKIGEKGPDIDVNNYTKISNCTISPYGNYLVIVGDFGQGSDRVQVRKVSDGSIIFTERAKGLPSHFDTQIDQNGDEIIAGVAKSGPYSGKVIKRRLSDGKVTLVCNHKYASHTSGRAIQRPGWVYVTYQNRKEKYPPYLNEVVAVKLDGSRTERICHLHSMKPSKGDALYKKRYLFESHAVPSPSGLRVLWASDWDSKDWPVQAYVADFRDRKSDK